MALVALGAYAAIVTAATTTSPSPELGLSSEVVVEIFVGANCTGKQRRLKMDDLVGGNHDIGWDSCGGAWDDGTPMKWPWWGSYRVAAGHAIMTGSRCYDSRNDGYPEYEELGMTSEAGCVSPDYTFTYVSMPMPPPSPPPLPPLPPSESPPDLIPRDLISPVVVSALLLLVAAVLIFLRQIRFLRDRAKFDLQILGREMRSLEQKAGSAAPSSGWRRRKSWRAACAAVAPARGEGPIDLPSTPQSCTGPTAGMLTKLGVPTKGPEISTDAALAIGTEPTKVPEISTEDAALEISTPPAEVPEISTAQLLAQEQAEAAKALAKRQDAAARQEKEEDARIQAARWIASEVAKTAKTAASAGRIAKGQALEMSTPPEMSIDAALEMYDIEMSTDAARRWRQAAATTLGYGDSDALRTQRTRRSRQSSEFRVRPQRESRVRRAASHVM